MFLNPTKTMTSSFDVSTKQVVALSSFLDENEQYQIKNLTFRNEKTSKFFEVFDKFNDGIINPVPRNFFSKHENDINNFEVINVNFRFLIK